jgi:hypothetical protein
MPGTSKVDPRLERRVDGPSGGFVLLPAPPRSLPMRRQRRNPRPHHQATLDATASQASRAVEAHRSHPPRPRRNGPSFTVGLRYGDRGGAAPTPQCRRFRERRCKALIVLPSESKSVFLRRHGAAGLGPPIPTPFQTSSRWPVTRSGFGSQYQQRPEAYEGCSLNHLCCSSPHPRASGCLATWAVGVGLSGAVQTE